jgi:hypothetical protein
MFLPCPARLLLFKKTCSAALREKRVVSCRASVGGVQCRVSLPVQMECYATTLQHDDGLACVSELCCLPPFPGWSPRGDNRLALTPSLFTRALIVSFEQSVRHASMQIYQASTRPVVQVIRSKKIYVCAHTNYYFKVCQFPVSQVFIRYRLRVLFDIVAPKPP